MFAIRSVFLAICVAVAAVAVPAAAQTSPSDCLREGVDDKCESWVATYDDPAVSAAESAEDVAVSPKGDFVYTAMRTTSGAGFDGKARWVIAAHDEAGTQQWLKIWGDPALYSFPTGIVVSPNGRFVYASGMQAVDQIAADSSLKTIAFEAATGEIVWETTYDGPAGMTDNARDLVVSPDGKTIYIAGISDGESGAHDYAAIAYDARTGEELWVTRWDGLGRGLSDSPFAISLNNRGSMLYLTGHSGGEGELDVDFGTIAIATKGANRGDIAWTARYDGVGNRLPDQAEAMAVSPDDRLVFVTGLSDDAPPGPPFEVNYGYATIAYNAVTGDEVWEARKQWEGTNYNSPQALAVDPSGERVVVTGQANSRQLDYGTVTYDTDTGVELWNDRYGLPDYDLELGKSIAMDPRGDTVYVSGISAKSPPGIPGVQGVVLYAPNADALTIAYDIATGERRWLARYNATTTDHVRVRSIAVSPDASHLYSAMTIDDQGWDYDDDDLSVSLAAYDIGPGIPIPEPPATRVGFVGSLRGDYSDVDTVTARLTNNYGDPIEEANVEVSLRTESRLLRTDEQGIVEFDFTLDDRPGTYPVEVAYEGENGVYSASNASDVYTIDREDVRLTLKLKRASRSLRAVLVDADSDEGITNRTLTFYAGRTKLGTARTDASGVAMRRVPRSISLDRIFKAVFAGDDFFRRSSAR